MNDLPRVLTSLERQKEKEPLRFYRPFSETSEEADSQLDFHESTKKHRWMFCGNRSGKTMAGAAEACFYALGSDGERYWSGLTKRCKEKYSQIHAPNEGWVVASDHNVQKEASQKWVMRLLPEDKVQKVRYKRHGIISSIDLENGSSIGFKSSEAGSKSFEGAGKRWIWFDEEPKYESVYNECLMRETGRDPLHIWGTMTPVHGLTFTYERIYTKRHLKGNLKVFQWASFDNPHLSDEIVEEFRDQFADEPDELQRRLYGMFVEKQGLVYPMFDQDVHVKESFVIPNEWDLYEGIDLGFANPSAVVWVAVAPSNVFYVVEELYQEGLTVPELARNIQEIRERGKHAQNGRYSPRLTMIDPSSQRRQQPLEERSKMDREEDIYNPRDILRSNGIWTKLADNSVRQGLETIRQLFRDGKQGPSLFVTDDCPNWIREIENYRLKGYRSEKAAERRNDPEEPQKKDDHLMDATRYVLNEKIRWVGPDEQMGRYQKKPKSSVTGY